MMIGRREGGDKTTPGVGAAATEAGAGAALTPRASFFACKCD